MGQGQGNYGNNARGFGMPQRGVNSQFGGAGSGPGALGGGGMGLPDWMNKNYGNPQMGLANPTDQGGVGDPYVAGGDAATTGNTGGQFNRVGVPSGYGGNAAEGGMSNQNSGRFDFGYNPGDMGLSVPPGTGGGDPNPANDRPIFGGGTGGPQGPYQLPVQTGGLEPRDIPLDYNGRGRCGGLLGQGGGISQQGYQSPYADMRSPQMGLRRF